jgi:DNA-binding CsgD family transcriptional regulator/tetratricopeptide (TPR) repeat protein
MMVALDRPGTLGLLERDAELAALAAVLDSVRAGMGRLVAVQGEAGIGKTALLGAMARMAVRSEVAVLRARGSELERDAPFGVALQLFERRLGTLGSEARTRAFRGAARLAAPLFDATWDEAPAAGGPATHAQERSLIHGLYWLASNLAERRAVVLIVDDAAWADRSSLTWMHYLAQRIEELPVVLLVASRPRDPAVAHGLLDGLLAHPTALVIEPSRLTPDAVEDMVRERLPEAEPEFCSACAAATEGNPFLVRELLSTLVHDGVEPVAENAPDVARTAPESVLRAVIDRLSRLPPAATAVARAAAVLGQEAPLRHAAVLAGLSLPRAADAADMLAAADVLRAGEPLAFVHPLTRSVVYTEVPAAARAGLHARAARLLAYDGAPPDRVAAHLIPARAEGSAWSVDALRAAARRAMAGGAPGEAAAYLRRALEEPPAPAERATTLVELASAEAAAGEAGAAERFAQALELVDEPRRRAELTQTLARVLAALGRTRDAAAAIDRALAELESRPGDEDLALALQATWVSISRGDVQMRSEAQARLTAVVERVGAQPSSLAERMMLAQIASEQVFAGESRDEAARLARLALGDGRLLELETSDGGAWIAALSALGWADHFEEFEHGLLDGLADARRRGSVLAFATCSYGLNFSAYYSGRIADAIADAHQALDAERYGWREYAVACRAQLAWAHVERGELDRADAALAPVESDPDRESLPAYSLALQARGRISLSRGHDERALDELREAGRLLRASQIPNPAVAPWASWAVMAAVRLGRLEEARELAAAELTASRRFGAPRALGISLLAAGVVEGAAEGVELMREAVATLERSPSRLEHARALTMLGGALRRAGHAEEAREPLREALELAHGFGAFALASGARSELIAAGARPRRPATTGVDALTPGEQRVATMAAAGMSNREIAEDLFVTVKAVQWHLRNVYRKLHVSGRDELPAALGEQAR